MIRKALGTIGIGLVLALSACSSAEPATDGGEASATTQEQRATETPAVENLVGSEESFWVPACVTKEGALDIDCLNTPELNTCPEGEWLAVEYKIKGETVSETGKRSCLSDPTAE